MRAGTVLLLLYALLGKKVDRLLAAILVLDGSLSDPRGTFSFGHAVYNPSIIPPSLAEIVPPSRVVYSSGRNAVLASGVSLVIRRALPRVYRVHRVRYEQQVRSVRLLPRTRRYVQPVHDSLQENLARVYRQAGHCGRCNLEGREEARVIISRDIPRLRVRYIQSYTSTLQHGKTEL